MRHETGQSDGTAATRRATAVSQELATDILNRVESLLLAAEAAVKPVEIDPYRGQLFELFVMADGAGLLQDDAVVDLSADGAGRELARRWNLASATEDSVRNRTKLSPRDLSKMRLLWSFMRMWMEWTYAWERWREFHSPGTAG